MITTDSHIHTDFSSDGSTSMKQMIEKAISIGLTDICFTDHMDYEFPIIRELKFSEKNFVFDPKPYVKSIASCKREHEPNINIRTGVEIGLKVEVEAKIKALLSEYNFDYVIGSVHVIKEVDPYHQEYWSLFESEEKGILTYFQTMLSCIETLNDFDALGHLDYIVRYAPSGNKFYSYEKFSDVIDEILRQCIKKDKALEINTSGYKKNKMPNPHRDVIRRYLDLGGELITIGSDAHTIDFLAYEFDKCKKMLIEIGFHQYVTYHGRKPIFHELI